MANVEHGTYWATFDRIRAALLKQEVMRQGTIQAFEAWVAKAGPHYNALIATVDEALAQHYGAVYCDWLDWLDDRRLAWRGEIRWQIPTQGPLKFTPPSTAGLMREIGKILGELGLEESTRRLGLYSAAPSQRTRGARGQGTVRKSPSPK